MNMFSTRRISEASWLQWLALCSVTQLQHARAETALSTLLIPDTSTTISLNLPPDSNDINFFVSTPDWYQYTAFGFGSSMSDALMLVMYASAENKGVTVSPRLSTGNTEPVHNPSIKVTVHDATINDNSDMIINATCQNCRGLPGLPAIVPSATSPMMFAVGPGLGLSSDDPDARIRRHVVYSAFTIDLRRAVGAGGIGAGVSGASSSDTVTLTTDQLHQDSDKAAAAHGILYAIIALAVAPFDSLVAGALGSKWAWMHGVTATIYFLFVLGAMIPGVMVSEEHVLTQKFRTPHQVIGLLTIVAMTIMFVWGFSLSWIKRAAKKRGQGPPEKAKMLGAAHKWACRVIWALLLVNVGLGMKLSEHRLVLLLAYVALAVGLLVILVPIYFCLWRCSKRKKEKEEELHELTIYDHNYH
ncbi:hypothetical protein VTI74DRAFT_7447 [Chaetomium olivicolor]